MDKMVILVKHEPRKQVIIHELGQYDTAGELANIITAGAPQGTIFPVFRWGNGIILTFNAISTDTEFMVKERAEGILHWDHVSFAPMKQFKSQVISQNNLVVDVVDVSKNETFDAITKFLNKKIKKQ